MAIKPKEEMIKEGIEEIYCFTHPKYWWHIDDYHDGICPCCNAEAKGKVCKCELAYAG